MSPKWGSMSSLMFNPHRHKTNIYSLCITTKCSVATNKSQALGVATPLGQPGINVSQNAVLFIAFH